MKALRIKDVAAKIGLGQSTIYRLVAQGAFPKRPVQKPCTARLKMFQQMSEQPSLRNAS
ncbi:AlpA family transcriptional regulator [Burkholderia glumae]|uniref:AlpA family transcriptional regulator n=1 Tax=Burkholderia glumae TaxID=337 RepID=UPI002151C35C|nr:AlpA family transcriptional regulator [Burkholderia glumae]